MRHYDECCLSEPIKEAPRLAPWLKIVLAIAATLAVAGLLILLLC